ncbi:uncharacterized protein KGF55_004621 [Candida pseudojiufengensis]|uniref:uncharacterized protein n=1 Tax=Candida pseudojiufengensis TaxID=497109 RepID=UPI0022252B17|nr:uncharacterized protein KGF55_004621 [Candida pseudojiufengensis]KAI5960329.1 hypothetical protein KGF55_004621 [Candida pseudojiufengensis]
MFRSTRLLPKRLPLRVLQHQQKRNIKISPNALSGLKSYGSAINALAAIYAGGLIVTLGSLYFLYKDANDRQNIPFELPFKDQVEAVRGINKDDVLEKPRYAVKHYRKLLFNLAKQVDSTIKEEDFDKYEIPIIDSETLVYRKSNKFSNFYIDMILRYSKALLAKGELDASINILEKVINDDLIYYKLGDAERLSECTRLLARVYQNYSDKVNALKRSIDMLNKTYSSIQLNDDLTLKTNSKISDELINCLNDLAFQHAKQSRISDKDLLKQSLTIYLSNLKVLSDLQASILARPSNQMHFPLFNASAENLEFQISSIKAHIAEILWAQHHEKESLQWNEELLKKLYYDNASSSNINQVLSKVLDNLVNSYTILKRSEDVERCQKLQKDVKKFVATGKVDSNASNEWYDNVVRTWSKIIYDQGPLGIILKPLQERYGKVKPSRELEDIEKEDEL